MKFSHSSECKATPLRQAIISRLSACLLVAALAPISAHAQQYSYDGNRWYEIEVTVFTNDTVSTQITEKPLSDTATLAYLPRLRLLREATASYQVDFNNPDATFTDAIVAEAPLLQDPPFSAGVAHSFKIDDFKRDPFIALDQRFWKLTQDVQKLRAAPDHQVLWHAMWRQPMQGSSQAPAIAVLGGEQFGAHNQLEGSIRFSDNNGRVNMDVRLWLSSFMSGSLLSTTGWKLPAQPEFSEEEITDNRIWNVTSVWQIVDSKELRPTDYYYLDNPAFGVLMQIRGYELPVKTSGSTEDDF